MIKRNSHRVLSGFEISPGNTRTWDPMLATHWNRVGILNVGQNLAPLAWEWCWVRIGPRWANRWANNGSVLRATYDLDACCQSRGRGGRLEPHITHAALEAARRSWPGGQEQCGGFRDGEHLDGAEADQSKPIHGNRRRASVGRRPNYAVVRRLPSYRCGTFPEQPTGFTVQTSDTARPYTTVGPKGIKGVTMGPIQSPAPAR